MFFIVLKSHFLFLCSLMSPEFIEPADKVFESEEEFEILNV